MRGGTKMGRVLPVFVISLAGAACLLSLNVVARERPLKIWSPAFAENAKIPAPYTCDGQDKSPPLNVEEVPPNARSLALIVDDPDAPGGTWVHWVVWNIDGGTREIAAGAVPKGAKSGINDFRKNGYGGPCPPSGTHRYIFKLYALDTLLDLPGKAVKGDLEKAMKGHIVGRAETIGRYR
jgi:Raf kinase inhibitor-like YbhB/YbcL family protein